MTKKYKVEKTFTFEGKRYKIYADTETEAIIKMANKIRDLEEGRVTINGNMTVKQWAEMCVQNYKVNLAPITLKNYKLKMNKWIIEEIGHYRIKDIKPMHCQAVLNKMNGKSEDLIRKVNQMLKFIFSKAVKNKMILDNPADDLTLPKGPKSTRRAITEKERCAILSVADTNPKYIYFLLMLFCGCRPSEAAEVKRGDIKNMDGENLLHIRGTKSSNADRFVPVPKYLFNRIPDKNPFDYLVTNENGNKLTTGNRQVLWKHFRRDLNIYLGCKVYRNQLIPPYPVSPDLTPYCLRHTYCTDLQKQSIDIRTAQYLMGHADIKLTANIYTHIDKTVVVEAARRMNEQDSHGIPSVIPVAVTVEK